MRFDKAELRTLGWLVFYDVNRTLGGLASMELLRRSLGARGWMTDEGHALFVAISRLTPGTNILAYCVALGWQLAHWRGALISLAAASIPASILIALLSATLAQIDQLSARPRDHRDRPDRRDAARGRDRVEPAASVHQGHQCRSHRHHRCHRRRAGADEGDAGADSARRGSVWRRHGLSCGRPVAEVER